MKPFSYDNITAGSGYIPELASGFDPTLPSLTDSYGTLSLCENAEAPCLYRIDYTLTAQLPVQELFVFVSRKNLAWHGSLEKGETLQRHIYVHTGEIVPRYHKEAMLQKQLFVTLAWSRAEHARIEDALSWDIQMTKVPDAQPASVKTIYLAGDSTVTDQAAELPYHPGACYSSWGQCLTEFTGPYCAVDNQAHSGLTTETFRSEGHMDVVLREIKPGDLCLFQFGHNDQKLPHLQAAGGYRDNLIRFVREIREKQALPVLVTPLGRNTWNADNTYLDLLAEQAKTVRNLGVELNVPVLDLHAYSTAFYQEYGFTSCCVNFHPGDATHTNEFGSERFACFIANALRTAFPALLPAKPFHTTLHPQDNLWELLKRESDGRNLTQEQKEQFDKLEKSVDNLIQAVKDAEKAAGVKA